jgi:hypothetical protein
VVTTIRVARDGVIPVEELDAVLVSGYAPADTAGWLREEWAGPAVGESSQWLHLQNLGAENPLEEIAIVGFVRGSTAVAISAGGADALVSVDQVAELGRLIDSRLS